MKFQFFGSRNLRTADDLRSVGKPKTQIHKRDDWNLDAVSALRVPILGSLQTETKTKYVSSIERTSQPNRSSHILRLVETDLTPSLQHVGIYSPCANTRRELHAQIASMAMSVSVFDAESIDIENAAQMNAWLIHMQDEDESPFLDAILDLDTYEQSLFLCEALLTDQCLKKVKEFIQ